MSPNGTATSFPELAQPNTVTSWSIFWALLGLSLSCIVHPLGSACGFEPQYRHSIRISPLVCIFDTGHLISEIYTRVYVNVKDNFVGRLSYANLLQVLLQSVEEVTTARLRHNMGVDLATQDEVDGGKSRLDIHLNGIFVDLRVRAVMAVLSILQYTKLCGYSGIPILFSIATLLFVIWVVLELVLLLRSLTRQPIAWLGIPYLPFELEPDRKSPVPLGIGIYVVSLHFVFIIPFINWSRCPFLRAYGWVAWGMFMDGLDFFFGPLLSILEWTKGINAWIRIPILILYFTLYLLIFLIYQFLWLYWFFFVLFSPIIIAVLARRHLPLKIKRMIRVGYRKCYLVLSPHVVNLCRLISVGIVIAVGMLFLKFYDPEGTSMAAWTNNLP